MDSNDVNKLFTTNGEDVWRMLSFCELPTATMLNIETGERVGGAVGSPNLRPFKKLIPEKGGEVK